MHRGFWVNFLKDSCQLLLAQSKNVFDERLHLGMLLELVFALCEKELSYFEIEVRQSVTKHGFLLSLLGFHFD